MEFMYCTDGIGVNRVLVDSRDSVDSKIVASRSDDNN